jgi:DNA gyrase subunit A
MAKENIEKEEKRTGIESRSISTEMKESYLDYAMSVITSRALPDVRDGMKPVHRRILYTMHEMNLSQASKPRKSAAVVGEVLGKYHPHGDTAVYDAMVQLAQEFKTRYPLVIGQGNFGSIDGDSAAAMRYTEAKMSKISTELLSDIDKDTVDWRDNYDGTRKEPIVLPSTVPQVLLNGTLGIAVGMATNIPPHNLGEVVDATIHIIDNPDATTDDLLNFVQGPDFPTGGIAFNKKDIAHAYAQGKGGVVVRGEAEIVEDKKGMTQIIISSIPYRVNKSDLISKIAELVQAKKVEGIKGLRDESTKDIRIVIDLKSGSYPQKVLNTLYKHTQLKDKFHYNMVALVDGVPQTLSLKGMLEEFILHREIVVKRRTEFELKKALAREHILLGLKKALDHIDKIIKLIKTSKDVSDARVKLSKEFKFSEIQANAILEMKLQKLAGLERQKIEEELKEVQALIKELKTLLASKVKMREVIKEELESAKEKYGDERRTKIVKSEFKSLGTEDLIPDQDSILVLTSGGYIKRTDPGEYKKQKRGGVGVVDLNTKEEDFVTTFLHTTTHADLLFFSDKGKVYQIKMYEVPEGKRATRGKSIMNFLSLEEGENVTAVLPAPKDIRDKKDLSVILVTKSGTAKKVSAESFQDVRRSGLIAIKLNKNDLLSSAQFICKGESVFIVTADGQSIHFKEGDVREMGRAAAGVRAIKLSKSDEVVGVGVLGKGLKEPELLVVSGKGYGKRTSVKEYKIQKRGGSGIKTAKVTEKTGKLIAAKIVDSEGSEIVAISKKSQVIRLGSDEVSSLSRATQGVRIMKLRPGDQLASVICL